MKLQARVKATGEVFNILEINIPMGRVSVYITEDTARDYRLDEVEVLGVKNMSLPPDTVWQKPHPIIDNSSSRVELFVNVEEQRRYEIAKAILPAIYRQSMSKYANPEIKTICKDAIDIANELVNPLKQNNYEQD